MAAGHADTFPLTGRGDWAISSLGEVVLMSGKAGESLTYVAGKSGQYRGRVSKLDSKIF